MASCGCSLRLAFLGAFVLVAAVTAAATSFSGLAVHDATQVKGFVHLGEVLDPQPNPQSLVTCGTTKARFTVLTSQLIRMEWAANGQFQNNATLSVLNRNLPAVLFQVTYQNGWCIIRTQHLELRYLAVGEKNFDPTNLVVTLTRPVNGQTQRWVVGTQPTGNLLGTIRTLDGFNGGVPLYCPNMTSTDLEDNHCSLAMISKDGWAILDDSDAAQWDLNSDWPWFQPVAAPSNATCNLGNGTRIDCNPGNDGGQKDCEEKGCCYNPVTDAKGNKVEGTPWCYFPTAQRPARSDLYFFGHGHDYNQAMADFYTISGRVSLLPRYLLGPQYSQWHAFNENDIHTLLEEGFGSSGVPLDVMVLDMDWHTTFYNQKILCADAEVDGWTGYTWETDLFPRPDSFIGSLKELFGLHVTNNMHPAAGVQCTEKRYPEMARAMGVDPATNVSIPYMIGDKKYSYNFFEHVLKPLGGPDGIDYWWIDWQQGESPLAPGVNPTIWVNYVFSSVKSWFNDGARSVIMARWGGVGSHRYSTIGFSGDVTTSWQTLQFQPYFATTASNLGFSWSFDIGGFAGQPDPELFTRWVQWGAVCPILRTHCQGKMRGGGFTRDIWLYPFDNFVIMRDAYLLRSKLVPYIYTSNFFTYQTGQALVRPLYYDYPESQEAYDYKTEYSFGRDMVVAPITIPSQQYNITKVGVWIPPGVWTEFYSGQQFTGPVELQRGFLLQEIPMYVRAGAVIPTRSPGTRQFGSAQEVPESLELIVYGGLSVNDGPRNSTYYDDDGITTAYTNGAYALTNVQLQMTSADSVALTIFPFEGSGFKEMPAQRNYQFQFVNSWPASSVTVNDVAIPFHPYSTPSKDSWSYDGKSLSVRINLVTKYDVKKRVVVKVKFTRTDTNLLKFGFMRKVNVAQIVKDLLDTQWGVYYPDMYPSLLRVSGSGLNAAVENIYDILSGFSALWAQAQKEVASLTPASPVQNRALALLAMA